jgi:peptide-methionine (R)-S-oxide reductase
MVPAAVARRAAGAETSIPREERAWPRTPRRRWSDELTEIKKTDEEWRSELSPTQYHVLREKGTERAFSGRYWNKKDDGMYYCAACDEPLFDSAAKFESGTGWPSFFEPATGQAVETGEDRTYGMIRTEVTCRKCGGHLGHVFEDGPRPTGLRYCINSESLEFKPRK